jgi:lipopolysaccharide/colanic/teichoic acid biosynthesis glycosyltransferase/glycosyltransferase involved in cell wall biosynthesis
VRVTHLGKFYPPVPGGMERVLEALCKGERSLDVDSRPLVVATSRDTVRETVDGVPVTRAGSILRVGSVWLSPSLIGLLKRDASDLIVLHEPNPMALLAYAIARPRQPLIVWYHAEVIRPRWRYRAFYHPFVDFALRRAARVVASSPVLIEQAAALAPHRSRSVVVPFGLRDPAGEPALSDPSVEAVRAHWNGPIVLFVGRLVPYKGVGVLLTALQRLRAAAVIVGDGPLRAELEREASALGLGGRVFFLGRCSDASVAAWYRSCDVLALPSTTAAEAFGLVQLEAMARGKPVVSTRLPSGVPWVNHDGVTGFTVPPGDAEALRVALARILEDADLRARMGQSARRRFLEHFTLDRMVAQTTALYAEVAAEDAELAAAHPKHPKVAGTFAGKVPATFARTAHQHVVKVGGLSVETPEKVPATFPAKVPGTFGGDAFGPPGALGGGGSPLKRAFDVALSGIGLVMSAPVWFVAAALIKLEDGGPIFYRQERVGAGGRTFTVLKFRSMIPDAERDSGPLQATAGDPRVTKVGRLLRATAMDELPQLVNIFRGDMSFVGPRALRPGEIETAGSGRLIPMEQIDGYHVRAAVQPGLTGIAQIYAPRDVARRQKFRYDRVYVNRRSFWLDLRLILLSFWISLRGTWEHRERKF